MAANADLTRGPALLSVFMGTASFAFATTAIRFCVRKRISNNVGLDDYAMGVASVVGLIGTIFSIIESVSMSDSAHGLEFDFLGQPWFMMGSTMAKISICLFFIRLVGAVKQWRILLSCQIFFMAVINLAFSLTTNLQCRPLEKLWNPSVPGQCWSPSVQTNIGYFQGAFSVFWWLFLSLFPVMIVRDLEMHRRMRWPFYFLSSLTLMAAIFTTVRTYETSQTTPGVYTFDTFFATALSILEQNIGIVAANVLPMGPLFSRRQRAAIRAESQLAHHRPHTGGSNRSSIMIIEGPRKTSYEGSSIRDNNNYNNHSRRASVDGSVASMSRGKGAGGGPITMGGSNGARYINNKRDSTAWPMGIIKTVEVEVVEEDLADIERAGMLGTLGLDGGRISRMSALSVEQDWAALLKSGPTPPGSRGPSRMGF